MIAKKIRVASIALCFSAVCLASCGGGTTGTSSTDGVKFAGYAEQPDGTRAADLSMTVRSGTTNQDLKDSGTNARGDFSMSLPASESVFVVDVTGVGSTTVVRQQQGPGTLTAKLSATSQGTLSASAQFEAQVDSASLCPALSSEGDELLIVNEVVASPCLVPLVVASQQLRLRDFRGSVFAVCDGRAVTIDFAGSNADGAIALDVSDAILRGCSEIRIVVSHPEAPGLESIFYVE